MNKRLIIAAVSVLALAAGCADTLNGEVTSKSVDPGYSYTYFQPMYSSQCSGNPMVCRQVQTGTIPVTNYVPPCYEITVQGKDDKSTGSTCLDESQWSKIEVGDTYVGDDVDPKDREKEL